MSKAFKSTSIPLSKQIEIAKFIRANKNMPVTEVVEHYDRKYTYNQLIRIAAKDKTGKLAIRIASKTKKKKLKEISTMNSIDEIFDKQIHFALAQLEDDKDAPAVERVAALFKLQQMMLSNHLKRADAGIVASIIRRFLPTATDVDIVKIYSEEVEKCKHSR